MASANGTSTGSTKVAERTRWRPAASPAGDALLHFARRLEQAVPRHDDGVVGGDEVLLGAVLDRPHAFLHRGVLHGDAVHAAIGLAALLRRAVHHVVVVLVDDRPERAGNERHMDAAALAHHVELHVRQRPRRMVGEGPGEAVLVVDRHPGMGVERVVAVGRHHRVPGHDPLGDAPVVVAVLGVAARGDEQAAGGFHDLELRLLVALVVRALGVAVQRIGVHVVAVQERDVARIDAALHRLQVVALLQPLAVVAMRGRQHRPFELRQRRLQLGRPHVGPEDPAALDQRIGLQLDLLAEAALGRLRRHLDALAGVVVFPAVIGAAQPVVLVAPEPQRHAAMRAELVGQREAALGVAPRQQPLGQELDPHRRAFVLRQFLGVHRRDPVAAEHLAHRRAGAGLRGEGVLVRFEHGVLLWLSPAPRLVSAPGRGVEITTVRGRLCSTNVLIERRDDVVLGNSML